MPAFVKLPFAVASAFVSLWSSAYSYDVAPCNGYTNFPIDTAVYPNNLVITDLSTCLWVQFADWGGGDCPTKEPTLASNLRTWPSASAYSNLGI